MVTAILAIAALWQLTVTKRAQAHTEQLATINGLMSWLDKNQRLSDEFLAASTMAKINVAGAMVNASLIRDELSGRIVTHAEWLAVAVKAGAYKLRTVDDLLGPQLHQIHQRFGSYIAAKRQGNPAQGISPQPLFAVELDELIPQLTPDGP